MSPLFVRVFLVMNGIFRLQISFTFAQNTCGSHSDCNSDYVCCRSFVSTKFRCRKRIFDNTSTTRSCFGYDCANNSDCVGLKDGMKLCCRSNRCGPCPQCVTNSDCNRLRFCCKKAWDEEARCSYTCIGESCQNNLDCATNECCSSGRCVKCSYPGCCRSRSDCPIDQYCCDKQNHGKCNWECVGENCDFDRDCAAMEHCHSHKCTKAGKCQTSVDCGDGSYCCKLYTYNNAVCARSCIGGMCIHDNDCGASDECCLNRRCLKCGDSCTSSFDCFSEAYCCKAATFGQNKCASKCFQESCIKSQDCVKPNTWCVGGTCADIKQCNTSTDCITSDGKQYNCCINSASNVCSKSCIAHECSSDKDCTSTECCEDSLCISQSKCGWKFPNWLIGVFVAITVVVVIALFACYSRSKIRQLNRRQSDENAQQDIVFSDNEHERVQNVYSDPPSETSISLNTRLHVSPPETQEQIYYSISRVSHNDFIEMVELPAPQFENEVSHERDQSIPNYPLASSGDHIRRTDNPNVPPPAYTFHEQPDSHEYDNILP